LSAGTSLIRTFGDESSSVADKVGSVMGSLTDIASAFVTGGLEGGIAAVVGTAVGAVLGQIEKAEKELEEERARITEESSTLKNEIKSNNDLVVSFNELLEAKGNSRDVDSELVASAKGVIEAHG
jgi:VIT1/CCC1 family predicted Fe2+/Mn2+ transporter